MLAEGVVGIGPVGGACRVGQIYHIAVGVVQVIARPHAAGPADQIGASKVIVGNASVFQLRRHIAAVQQEGRPDEAGHLAGTDTGGVVGVIGKRARAVGGAELVEMVVGIGGASAAADGFADDIAVAVVGVADGFGGGTVVLNLIANAVVAVVDVGGVVILRAGDAHAGAISGGIVGVVHRHPAGFRLLRQTTHAVVGITGDFARVVSFGFLIAAGVVGIVEGRNDRISQLIGNAGDPVGLVVGVAFHDAVGVGQTGAVAVGIVGIFRLLDTGFADGGQAVQIVIGVGHVLNDRAVPGQGKAGPVICRIVGILLGIGDSAGGGAAGSHLIIVYHSQCTYEI